MDKKKSVLNVTISILFKIALTVSALLVRRYLIKCIGNDINGLNSLFVSIIGFLSVAELGIGTAIPFCMYKPIVDGDTKKVAALYGLFKKIYYVVGGIILLAGLAVTPFLPYLAADYSNLEVNIYVCFLLMLASIVITYAFSAKISLINAYKNNYITTIINSTGMLLQNGLQIACLFIFKSFEAFLICMIISSIFQWALTEIITRKKYPDVIALKEKIDSESLLGVKKSVKAMFMHKIGGVLVNSADSIIISAFIGVVALGGYSNYTTVIVSMTSILLLFFTPLTSVVGHFVLKTTKEEMIKCFNFLYAFNFILGSIFFIGYYAVIDDFVTMFFGGDLVLSRGISFVITLNYFIQFMRQAVLLFRDATGTFYNDRWKPLIEGLINVGLSILLVVLFPEDFKIIGVIVATIITNLSICHVVEPHVLFKYGFKSSEKKFLIKNYFLMALFSAALFAVSYIRVEFPNSFTSFLVNGIIAVLFSLIPCSICIVTCRDFIDILRSLVSGRHAQK